MYVSPYLFDFFLRTNTFPCIIHVCGLRFLFLSWFFLSISFCLSVLIVYQFAMNGVLNIMSRFKTNWYGMDCSVVWYMLITSKAVAANISDQGSCSSRYFF